MRYQIKKRLSFRTAAIASLVIFAAPFAFTGDRPPEDAEVKANSCLTAADTYQHGALKFFNSQLCLVNTEFPSRAEEVLRKLIERMGLNPDLSALAADGTATNLESKTLTGKTVTGTVQKVVSPDTFAGTYDYLAKISVDGSQHIRLYWSGTGSSSKGFLTMGGQGFKAIGKHLLYVRWDRTVATAQSVSVLATHIGPGSTYLANVQPQGLATRGDRALFGAITFNDETKAVTVQMTTIGARRGAQANSNSGGCFMMYATGTKGGQITVAKTHDAKNETGDTTSSSTQDGSTNMDSATVVDSEDTANGTGNSNTAPGFAMNYSCADLAAADDASGDAFYGNAVNFELTKSEVDALFAAN